MSESMDAVPEPGGGSFSLHEDFAIIAREGYDRFLAHKQELIAKGERVTFPTFHEVQSNSETGQTTNVPDLTWVAFRQAMVCVVFSCMAAEAYMFDYAARHLSKTQQVEVSGLSTVPRWTRTLQLSSGRPEPIGKDALASLTRLVAVRNSLVHSRSFGWSVPEHPVVPAELLGNELVARYLALTEAQERLKRAWAGLANQHLQLAAVARDAMSTLQELAAAVESIDPTETASVELSGIEDWAQTQVQPTADLPLNDVK